MAFPESRIISTKKLAQQIVESNRNGERFCFILGSGASVESGIPSGNTLEMKWMNCIMGEAEDMGTPPMDADETRQCAAKLYKEGHIQHNFKEIEAVWNEAKKSSKVISSSYYFDIYKLRFFPNPRNGYRYLERLMECCEPSLGYHTLAMMLAEQDKNNLVITTNFDSLVEDALFLYTDKKPLVVSHESLAGYIESDIRRPIIAKVHRGLLYAPFNSPDTTQELKKEWREALDYAFSTYTPIVVGYGGGDHSLMAYLVESASMRHGIYWCYRENSDFPEINIQNFVEKKDGCFVAIGGFDALMMEIGNEMYHDEITPTRTQEYLKKQCEQRVQQYNEQWDKLNKDPDLKSVLQSMNRAEQQEEEKRAREDALTIWDYIRRGDRAWDEKRRQDAIDEYTKAIDLDPNSAAAYSRRGFMYGDLELHEKAIEDYTATIRLMPDNSAAYNNRGTSYHKLGQYEKSIKDYTDAIRLAPNDPRVYNNRGHAYDGCGQREKAIEDYIKVIDICTKALAVEPNEAGYYFDLGGAYNSLEKYEPAIENFTKGLALNAEDASAYNNRAFSYISLNQYEKAIEDCTKAIAIHPYFANPYRWRGSANISLEKYEDAIRDLTEAIKLRPQYKEAYIDRAKAYRSVGKNALAEADEKHAAGM